MRFDLETLDPGMGYKLLAATVVPRPIAWVTTQSAEGAVNCAPFSFFNAMGGNPPIVTLGLLADAARGWKDTPRNILETGEFVVNLVPYRLAEQMNITCVDAPNGVNELELAGLTAAPSAHVRPPRIAESPISFEARVMQTLETGPHQLLVVGQVLAVHVDDDLVKDAARGHIETRKLDLIARGGGADYYREGPTFQMTRPRWADLAPKG
ncbi:NADH-FMN oxidoreductase RutF, flavin reductase (DIM6/NTAB) family [Gemmobacter aquatilis]|uniref:NADH-FMN oxidoreductase RutF, flavin reductase (DIM6/NTAB) family n=1 Tax=Gemmobacter aquatilis TaxID=933059 RepID=A0A1H8IVL0_9RHOB|nr:flavin reductase family protein [Gemmobacter aquatilis]SEN72399.1 NADH-FMN oxidoreductase RutF, flavin reductase (DIM6/NTAB) family [Gemmobacter aquatilis]